MLALTFQIGATRLALDIHRVREVVPRVHLERVAGGPAWLAGMFVYRGGVVPRDPCNYDTPLETAARGALAAYASGMDANRVQEGAAQLVALAGAANRYVEETAPYKLAKQAERGAELDSVLANLARTVGRLAVLAQPFLPATAQTVWDTLGPPPSQPLASVRLSDLNTLDLAGREVRKPPILFPKPRLPQA